MRKLRRNKREDLAGGKEKKAFRIWVIQPDAWEEPQGVRRRRKQF
jgi:hypothetical protein